METHAPWILVLLPSPLVLVLLVLPLPLLLAEVLTWPSELLLLMDLLSPQLLRRVRDGCWLSLPPLELPPVARGTSAA